MTILFFLKLSFLVLDICDANMTFSYTCILLSGAFYGLVNVQYSTEIHSSSINDIGKLISSVHVSRQAWRS